MPSNLPAMSFVLPPALKTRLQAAAAITGLSASEIIRTGIELALKRINKDGKMPQKV